MKVLLKGVKEFMTPIIVLLTDLGLRDAYVGMIKGVIARIAPEARIIDLSHQIPAGDVREGAFDLFVSYRYFPAGTIFCCVVDPGVGSARRAVALDIVSSNEEDSSGPYTFVGPDNGLFTGVMLGMEVSSAISLENPDYHLSSISTTFHGRDIFAPVAAHLAAGADIAQLGPTLYPETLAQLAWTEPRKTRDGDETGWEADPIHADRFGNLVTNLHHSLLEPEASQWHVKLGDIDIGPIRRTFADVRPGRPLAYVGSSGLLELAVRDQSAKALLNVGPDSMISVLRRQ